MEINEVNITDKNVSDELLSLAAFFLFLEKGKITINALLNTIISFIIYDKLYNVIPFEYYIMIQCTLILDILLCFIKPKVLDITLDNLYDDGESYFGTLNSSWDNKYRNCFACLFIIFVFRQYSGDSYICNYIF